MCSYTSKILNNTFLILLYIIQVFQINEIKSTIIRSSV